MEDLERAREWLAQATSLAVLTGAGISAESGVPTFRGAGGLWKDYKPEELANAEAFARNPKLVWEWYNWRREIIARAEPNPGHRALVEFESASPASPSSPRTSTASTIAPAAARSSSYTAISGV